MVKAASILSLVMSFLVIFKMDGDMGSSFVLMLMEEGMYSIHSVNYIICFPKSWLGAWTSV